MVTGGAGYIGAHVVRALQARNETVVVYDDLSTGSASRVNDVAIVEGSILDQECLAEAISAHKVEGVIHLAAKKQVGQSVEQPLWYYEENVEGLRRLLAAMADQSVGKLVFSSSAATYGMPDVDMVTEDTPCAPLSPYGETKLIGEWLVRAAAKATGMSFVAMRYFNVAGAGSPELGDPAVLNLIPMVFDAVASGREPSIFGADYDTPDGTCVRDYVHVGDLADAHVEALLRMDEMDDGLVVNVGTGTGSSVREVISEISAAMGRELEPVIAPRRAGDPARIVASVDRIRDQLGWTASHDLTDMVTSAWEAWTYQPGK